MCVNCPKPTACNLKPLRAAKLQLFYDNLTLWLLSVDIWRWKNNVDNFFEKKGEKFECFGLNLLHTKAPTIR